MSVSFYVIDAPQVSVEDDCSFCWQERMEEPNFSCKHCLNGKEWREEDSTPSPNFNNSNARTILAVLMLPNKLTGELPADDVDRVLMTAKGAVTDAEQRRIMSREAVDLSVPGGCRVIECGTTDEHNTMRLEAMVRVLRAAKKLGKGIHWA